MHIRDLMSSDIISVHPGAPLSAVTRKLHRYRITALPVVEEGVLVGIITGADLKAGLDQENEIVADHMSLPVITCREDDSETRVRELMQQHGYAQLPVMGAEPQTEEKLVGIITQKDLDRARGQAPAEGEIPQAA